MCHFALIGMSVVGMSACAGSQMGFPGSESTASVRTCPGGSITTVTGGVDYRVCIDDSVVDPTISPEGRQAKAMQVLAEVEKRYGTTWHDQLLATVEYVCLHHDLDSYSVATARYSALWRDEKVGGQLPPPSLSQAVDQQIMCGAKPS
jgi:hypothetical protein